MQDTYYIRDQQVLLFLHCAPSYILMHKAIYIAFTKPTIMRRHGSMQYEESMVPNTSVFRTSDNLQFRNHAVFFQNGISFDVFMEFYKLKCRILLLCM